MTILSNITNIWDELDKHSWPDVPVEVQPLEEIARKLDENLGKSFIPHIKLWEEGLISSIELLQRMTTEALKNSPNKLT